MEFLNSCPPRPLDFLPRDKASLLQRICRFFYPDLGGAMILVPEDIHGNHQSHHV